MLCALLHAGGGPVRIVYADEARVGLVGCSGRRLSSRGVRPVSPAQREYKWTFLWQALCPADGAAVLMKSTHLCTLTFNYFLTAVSEKWPDCIVVLVLDGAAYHFSGGVEVPANVRLVKLPPYSPELNPVERMWLEMRRALKGTVFSTLEEAENAAIGKLDGMTEDEVKSLAAGWLTHQAWQKEVKPLSGSLP